MKAKNFKFRDRLLSDFGLMICSFGEDRSDILNGSAIEFNQVSTNNGAYWLNAGSSYSQAITTTFSICKDPCVFGDIQPITGEEAAAIMRWLNTPKMYPLQLLEDEYEELRFVGSFTQLQRVEYNGSLYGFTVTFTTNRPYALQQDVTKDFESGTLSSYDSYSVSVFNNSDIVPLNMSVKVTFKKLNENASDDNSKIKLFISSGVGSSEIDNCVVGETITIDFPKITSDKRSDSEIAKNFNFKFPKILKGHSINNIGFNTVREAGTADTGDFRVKGTVSFTPIRKVGV